MAAKISNWLGTRSHRSNLSGALPLNFLLAPFSLKEPPNLLDHYKLDWSNSENMKIRRLPDWLGRCLIKIRQRSDQSGCCLNKIRQLPDWSGSCLIGQAVAWSKSGICRIDQAATMVKSGSCLIEQAAARLKSGPRSITGNTDNQVFQYHPTLVGYTESNHTDS